MKIRQARLTDLAAIEAIVLDNIQNIPDVATVWPIDLETSMQWVGSQIQSGEKAQAAVFVVENMGLVGGFCSIGTIPSPWDKSKLLCLEYCCNTLSTIDKKEQLAMQARMIDQMLAYAQNRGLSFTMGALDRFKSMGNILKKKGFRPVVTSYVHDGGSAQCPK